MEGEFLRVIQPIVKHRIWGLDRGWIMQKWLNQSRCCLEGRHMGYIWIAPDEYNTIICAWWWTGDVGGHCHYFSNLFLNVSHTAKLNRICHNHCAVCVGAYFVLCNIFVTDGGLPTQREQRLPPHESKGEWRMDKASGSFSSVVVSYFQSHSVFWCHWLDEGKGNWSMNKRLLSGLSRRRQQRITGSCRFS